MTGYIELIEVLVGLLALWGIWYYGWRIYLLDRFRAELTGIDQALSAIADCHPGLAETAEYDSIAWYTKNAEKAAPHLTFLHALISGLSVGFQKSKDVAERVARIEHAARGHKGDELRDVAQCLMKTVTIHFIFRSPSLWIPCILLVLIALLFTIVKGVQVLSRLSWEVARVVTQRIGLQPELPEVSRRVQRHGIR